MPNYINSPWSDVSGLENNMASVAIGAIQARRQQMQHQQELAMEQARLESQDRFNQQHLDLQRGAQAQQQPLIDAQTANALGQLALHQAQTGQAGQVTGELTDSRGRVDSLESLLGAQSLMQTPLATNPEVLGQAVNALRSVKSFPQGGMDMPANQLIPMIQQLMARAQQGVYQTQAATNPASAQKALEPVVGRPGDILFNQQGLLGGDTSGQVQIPFAPSEPAKVQDERFMTYLNGLISGLRNVDPLASANDPSIPVMRNDLLGALSQARTRFGNTNSPQSTVKPVVIANEKGDVQVSTDGGRTFKPVTK